MKVSLSHRPSPIIQSTHANRAGSTKSLQLLVIERHPYGKLIDAEKLCHYALAEQNVTFLSFAEGKDTGSTTLAPLPGHVRWLRVPHHGGVFARYIRFVSACIHAVRQHYDLVYLYYFPGCSVVRLASWRWRAILDIRTAATSSTALVRSVLDVLLKLETFTFRHIAIVSDAVRDRLGLTRAYVVPLGADLLSSAQRSFETIELLYIGTLRANRRVMDTIEGLALFRAEVGEDTGIRYTIIGEGSERPHLEARVKALGLERCVRITGYVPHHTLHTYLGNCNVGISYVPITSYYDAQPPTKTYEYLLAGLPVIATATSANRDVINRQNGILIGDSPSEFCAGLRQLSRRRLEFDSEAIRAAAKRYAWPELMRDRAWPFIDAIMKS
jgi:glycosyltransferase involved in cell wall biosynthesis